ncbi:hypothetical protein [Aeromicrobium alkaliterrae]|uniref:Uncharacterized protein n=1 Tax=Aeromicrobium alkaliterrae TaxID=302168 RepID=A0ABN2K3H4_9ACTN
MKKSLVVINALAGAALLTLVTAAVILLVLMFSTDGDVETDRRAFFGSLMFQTVEQSDGSTAITAGVDDPIPLIALFVFLAVVLAFIQVAYRLLKIHRQRLLEERGLA